MDALEKALGKQAFLLLDEQLGKKWVVTFWDILFSFKGWRRIAVPAEAPRLYPLHPFPNGSGAKQNLSFGMTLSRLNPSFGAAGG